MRKIFLLVFLSTTLFSCSSSDSDNSEMGGFIKFKVNGTQRLFDVVEVSPVIYMEGTPDEFTELEISGYNDQLPAEHFSFRVRKGDMDDVVYMDYFDGENEFSRRDLAFAVNITENGDAQRLKGTFSGTMEVSDQPANNVAVTQGIFNFTY